MPQEKKCPRCGASLPTGALGGLCPACLLQQGASAETGTQPEGPVFEPPSVVELARAFPQLEIIELIGKGGMGAVYKARQPALDRFVALKILPPEVGSGAGFPDRFNREARALARLNHPNIVNVHEFGQVNGLHYFIMEYVDGANLRQLEQAGRLSAREALQIVPQICDALQYAHDEGVVHRDIKPENVLVDRKGRVKIADFGLAKILGREPSTLRLTNEGQVMGTPHYMAPEQVEHPLQVDHRADIYALGVVFYEMLTGELPLGKFAPPSRKVSVDVRLDEVVLRSLEKEPEQRYQKASQVKSDVESISATMPKAPPVPSQTTVIAPHPPVKEELRRQLKWPAIGLLVTGILDWVTIPVILAIVLPNMARTAEQLRFTNFPVFVLALLPLGLCSLMIFGALKMLRGESYWAALLASFLAMLITPGNIVGLPVGIWALTVLSRKEVQQGFRGNAGGYQNRFPLFRFVSVPVSVLVLLGSLLYWGTGRPQELVEVWIPWLGIMLGIAVVIFGLFRYACYKDNLSSKIVMGLVLIFGLLCLGATLTSGGGDILSNATIAVQGMICLAYFSLYLLQKMNGPFREAFKVQTSKAVGWPWVLFAASGLIIIGGLVLGIAKARHDNESPVASTPPLAAPVLAAGPPFAASLPQGTVELVAVSDSSSGRWWQPDGRLLETAPFQIPKEELARLPKTDFHLFVFRVNRPGANLPEPEWSIDLVRPVAGFEGRKIQRTANLRDGGESWWVAAPMQSKVQATEVKLGLPSGGWANVAKVSSPGLENTEEYRWPNDGNWQVKFTEVKQEGPNVGLALTRRANDKLWTLREIAVDTNGVEHVTSKGGAIGKANEPYTWHVTFPNLRLEQIQSFIVQARRCDWATFRNVSLEPGRITEVQISGPTKAEGAERVLY